MYNEFEGCPVTTVPPRRFASPYPPGSRSYLDAAMKWLSTGEGPPPQPPDDPLKPLKDTGGRKAKRLIGIRVPGWLVDLTKEMARQHQTHYQEIFRLWLEQGLARALGLGGRESGRGARRPRARGRRRDRPSD